MARSVGAVIVPEWMMRALKLVWILLALTYAVSESRAEPVAGPSSPGGGTIPGAVALDDIPVSTVPLGGFPYFALPAGYQPVNPPESREFGHFPFWTGTALHDVDGKVFLSLIGAKDGKTYSSYELKKNIEAVLTQAGGRKLTDSQMPTSVIDTLPEEVKMGMYEGLGNVYSERTQTWVIRRPDRQIWVHFVPGSSNASWTILETKPFAQTASLLPAEQLKQDIDKTGRGGDPCQFRHRQDRDPAGFRGSDRSGDEPAEDESRSQAGDQRLHRRDRVRRAQPVALRWPRQGGHGQAHRVGRREGEAESQGLRGRQPGRLQWQRGGQGEEPARGTGEVLTRRRAMPPARRVPLHWHDLGGEVRPMPNTGRP